MSLIEEITERVRLAPAEDEDLATLSIVHKLILPQVKESSKATSKPGSVKKMEPVTRRMEMASTPVMDGHALGYSPSKKKI